MAGSTEWVVEKLSDEHEFEGFACGEGDLDSYLTGRAVLEGSRNFSQAFVLVIPPAKRVLGYYTLSASSVAKDELSRSQARSAPYETIPAVLLGRLAVDQGQQGQGLGEYLLMDALARAERLTSEAGVRLVELAAMSDRARDFYLHFGFVALRDDPHHLYISMKQIRQLGLNDGPSAAG